MESKKEGLRDIYSNALEILKKYREKTEIKDEDKGSILAEMTEKHWIEIDTSQTPIKIKITEKGERILKNSETDK